MVLAEGVSRVVQAQADEYGTQLGVSELHWKCVTESMFVAMKYAGDFSWHGTHQGYKGKAVTNW
jgi:hypothetical protein